MEGVGRLLLYYDDDDDDGSNRGVFAHVVGHNSFALHNTQHSYFCTRSTHPLAFIRTLIGQSWRVGGGIPLKYSITVLSSVTFDESLSAYWDAFSNGFFPRSHFT